MSELFSAFGLDWRLLVINLINFGLLLLILWYFLYTPLLNMLERRRRIVAEGIEHAARAERKMREIDESKSQVLGEAGREADAIVAHARKAAGERERELIAQGEVAAARLVADAETQARELKQQAIADSRAEVAKLVVLGIEKVIKTGR